MNTQQQQAYLEGFVKRASEYGFDQEEAVELLKSAYSDLGGQAKDLIRSGFDNAKEFFHNNVTDPLESMEYNNTVRELTGMGLPHHVADYGMKTLNPGDIADATKKMFLDRYNSDAFNAEHPMIHGALESAKGWLNDHNFDPTTAALAAGGTALLGGGYMLGKHLNKKKHDQENVHNFYQE